jgi:hypothetical protein
LENLKTKSPENKASRLEDLKTVCLEDRKASRNEYLKSRRNKDWEEDLTLQHGKTSSLEERKIKTKYYRL